MSFASDGPSPKTRKRDQTDAHLQHKNITTPIILQTDGGGPDGPWIELRPRLIAPRKQLPFEYTNRDQRNQPCYFKAWIRALEELDVDTSGAPTAVLIAETTGDDACFAVERLQPGLYALCPLHKWTALDKLDNQSSKKVKDSTTQANEGPAADAPWWDHAAVTIPTGKNASTKQHSRPRLSMSLTLRKSHHGAGSENQPSSNPPGPKPNDTNHGLKIATHDEAQLNAATAVEEFGVKYLEALYISNTSLAYFAKGPLTRLRTALQPDNIAQDCTALSRALQDMIMNVSVNDRKYNTTLPDLLREIPTGLMEDDQDMVKRKQVIGKRSRKRTGLSRSGLFPHEEENALQWWLRKESEVDTSSTHADRVKEGLDKQRTRETQLQIVLILEAMINERPRSSSTDRHSKSETTDQRGNRFSKAKKPLNLQSLLDIHVDRLCIWQSTQNGFDIGHSNLRPKSSHGTYQANALQDFCTEVLVPFFAARMPQRFAQICQKMGTVGVISPARPTAKKPCATSQGQFRPGTAVTRRSLQCVATDTKSGVKKSLTLSRSATDISAIRMKREDSRISLDDIPVQKPCPQPDLRHTRREVDLDALTKATEAKMKRKALIEQELHSAINVLKKPNSRMAVKDFVDFSDDRAIGKSKRKRQPTQHIPNQTALVKATPRTKRTRTAHMREINQDQDEKDDVFAPPSSIVRALTTDDRGMASIFRQAITHRDDRKKIDATPSRRIESFIGPRPTFHVAATPSKSGLRDNHGLFSDLPMLKSPEKDSRQQPPSKTFTAPTDCLPKFVMGPASPASTRLSGPILETIAATPLRSKPAVVLPRETSSLTLSHPSSGAHLQRRASLTGALKDDFDVYRALGWDDEGDVF